MDDQRSAPADFRLRCCGSGFGLAAGLGLDAGVADGVGLPQLIGDRTQIKVAVWSALAPVILPPGVNSPVLGS